MLSLLVFSAAVFFFFFFLEKADVQMVKTFFDVTEVEHTEETHSWPCDPNIADSFFRIDVTGIVEVKQASEPTSEGLPASELRTQAVGVGPAGIGTDGLNLGLQDCMGPPLPKGGGLGGGPGGAPGGDDVGEFETGSSVFVFLENTQGFYRMEQSWEQVIIFDHWI